MISTIIEALDLAASGKLPTALRHGLAELQPEIGPAVFNGTDWTPIGNDNGTFSYWRLTGPVRERVGESALTCANVFTVTYPMRLVSVVDRLICNDILGNSRAAATAVRGAERELRTVLGANLVEVGAANVLTTGVYRAEFGADDVLPTGRSIVAIDLTISVTGNATCFDPCDDTKSLLCALVEAATWAKIKACMSEGQIEAATDDLCDGGGETCPLDVFITVNGELAQVLNNVDPCEENNITVNVTYA
jgi:hypothetical protein